MPGQIKRWGNSLAVRIPGPLARSVGLEEGMAVELTVKNRHLVVAPARVRYRLSDLLRAVKPGNRHSESWAGGAVGKEHW